MAKFSFLERLGAAVSNMGSSIAKSPIARATKFLTSALFWPTSLVAGLVLGTVKAIVDIARIAGATWIKDFRTGQSTKWADAGLTTASEWLNDRMKGCFGFMMFSWKTTATTVENQLGEALGESGFGSTAGGEEVNTAADLAAMADNYPDQGKALARKERDRAAKKGKAKTKLEINPAPIEDWVAEGRRILSIKDAAGNSPTLASLPHSTTKDWLAPFDRNASSLNPLQARFSENLVTLISKDKDTKDQTLIKAINVMQGFFDPNNPGQIQPAADDAAIRKAISNVCQEVGLAKRKAMESPSTQPVPPLHAAPMTGRSIPVR